MRQPKFCSLQCAYRERRGDKSPKFRGCAVSYRGVGWVHTAEIIRARDEYLCGICRELPDKTKHHVDHVIPFRLMKLWGLDPNHYDNLQTLCNSCHSTKHHVEDRLLKGDLLGFLCGLVAMNYPIGRIRAACAVAELTTKGLPNVA
jgi:5-methylcytosine-specific restriction endonuclease McrA